jgi:hypothetical protein
MLANMKKAAILLLIVTSAHSMDYLNSYKQMNKLNDMPIDNNSKTASLCGDPRMTYGPHVTSKLTYFANDLAYTVKNNDKFPIGAIVVKEKVGDGKSQYANIITIMEKAKLDGKPDDWKYTIISTEDGKDLTEQFKKEMPTSCVDCHSKYKNDYVSDSFFSLRQKR